jgi:hypothetical protein
VVDENMNAQRFEIEKSFNGRDFSLVGVVLASSRDGRESYSFDDKNSGNGKVMYRLRMIGNGDKNTEYSRILIFNSEKIDNQIKIINSLINDKLSINYNSELNQNVSIRIFDMAGRVHMNLRTNIYAGVNVINIPLAATIRNGMYIVDINDGAHTSKNAKFIKN